MSKKWHEATKAYAKAQEKAGRVFFFTPKSSPIHRNKLEAVQTAALQLDLFLDTPSGVAALELLRVSEKRITLGRYTTGSGYNTHHHEYFLNGTGLYLAVSGLPYTHSVPTEFTTETRSITSEEAVHVCSLYKTSTITGFMPWLRAELDKIAAAAPQPEP